MQDEYLLARYAGCLLLAAEPALGLVNFAERELVYLDAVVSHRPWLESRIKQLQEVFDGSWHQAPANRPNPR
jgi:hypothetical protein